MHILTYGTWGQTKHSFIAKARVHVFLRSEGIHLMYSEASAWYEQKGWNNKLRAGLIQGHPPDPKKETHFPVELQVFRASQNSLGTLDTQVS